jgi:hypothetical protein
MRFEEVYGRYLCGRLSCEEAVLGMSVSSFFRWRQRYELTLTHISLEQLRSSYSSQIWQLAGVEQENGDAGRCALLGRDTVRVG